MKVKKTGNGGIMIMGDEEDTTAKLPQKRKLDIQWGNNIVVDLSDNPKDFHVKTQWGTNFYIQIQTDNPEEMRRELKSIFKEIHTWIQQNETAKDKSDTYAWFKHIEEGITGKHSREERLLKKFYPQD